ncbi:putative hotdog family 3-hydroxylacyl-ACP dehydratase [Rhodococcus sp. OAS809]|uniref:hypothetical protein n=1 Tax=Rhodococcus sp. OAS809 TaxID=2663874 RepID=UPI001788EA16
MTNNFAGKSKASPSFAYAIVEYAHQAIGPYGTLAKVHADDAPLVRAAFITRLAETAIEIMNGEAK